MDLSIVVPLYQEEGAVPELITRLTRSLDSLDCRWEAILVDDGSTDRTWSLIRDAAARDDRFRAIRLTRNFGHQPALTAGLWAAEGDAIVTMDGDLQHPPEVVPSLVAKGREGFDVVYATRSDTDSEGWFKVTSARIFYWLLNRLASLDLPPGAGDFRYMSRRVVRSLLDMPERSRFLRGMTRWTGYSQAVIEYDRGPRRAGDSKYSFRNMLRFALDALVSFSALPLRIASVLGIVFSLLGGVYLLYVLYIGLFTGDAVPGWTSVIIAVLILGGVQLACLGIIGQYLGRVYDEVKGRPIFLVLEDTRETGTPLREEPHAAMRIQEQRAAYPSLDT
jgi:glycosyltransferase involved in cell wall biosynthesis